MVTEQGWQPFYLHVHSAAESMQDDYELRYVPSPSSIGSCRLRQWFMGKKWPRTNRIPVESLKKMESGKVIEDYWRAVYTKAGFLVVSPTPPLTMGDMRSQGGDGLLFVETEECAQVFGMPVGSSALLELKDFGAWTYMDFVLKGLKESSSDYWWQIQSYLHGYNREYCVFHAGMADSSGTKWIWKRIKKQEEEIPPFWIEVVKRDPAVAMKALGIAGEVKWAIDNINDRVPIELRDYNPIALLPEKKYPCGYCGWAEACVGKDAAGRDKIIPIR